MEIKKVVTSHTLSPEACEKINKIAMMTKKSRSAIVEAAIKKYTYGLQDAEDFYDEMQKNIEEIKFEIFKRFLEERKKL